MKTKATYEKPTIQEYGSVFGLTKGHYKMFGPGDGIVLVDSEGNDIGNIDWAPSAFH